MKRFHLFTSSNWWDGHPGMYSYYRSYDSVDAAKSAYQGFSWADDCESWAEISETQPDGSLKLVCSGAPEEISFRKWGMKWKDEAG